MASILDTFMSELRGGDFSVVEQVRLPGRPERRAPIPSPFCQGPVGTWLRNDPRLAKGLWSHQSAALAAINEGHNVVLATGTASGKSLVFQAAALDLVTRASDARVLVFYPLKALASDQLQSWRRVVREAGLAENIVARLDGDTLADERKTILENANIILMTPDVCHAWLMRHLSLPTHRRFLARLALVIIDEAHVLEGVFGSNFAFLFRRLHAARELCGQQRPLETPLRAIAASATISKPREHLRRLTGLNFVSIEEPMDGAPRHDRTLMHVACNGRDAEQVLADLHKRLAAGGGDGSFITFVDSRQAVERIAIQSGRDSLIKPYRSGYEPEDRAAIEQALREGTLRGVVCTSALELGIDIPHFVVGMNIGVPSSRKAFRQRLGRVGRVSQGAFAIFAETIAFHRYGTTLEEYYRMSVEPAHLYLANRFMQFTHARCLAEELEALGVSGQMMKPPLSGSWPEGFGDVFEFAHARGARARPREFDHVARIGGDAPHINYPLRSVGEESFAVVRGRSGVSGMPNRIGEVSLQQAIREAYPGAIYLHLARRWKVWEWRSTAWERVIRVAPAGGGSFTRPLIRTFVNLSVEHDSLVEGHFRRGESGFVAECQLQITERVEGLVERGERRLYRDLRQENPAFTPKTRDFRTTGVVFAIEEDWFAEPGVKQRLAEVLRDLFSREHSVSPQDAGFAATNISLVESGMRRPLTSAFVLYDATQGSLRLTEPAYTHCDALISRLERAAASALEGQAALDEESAFLAEVAPALRRWYERLGPEQPEAFEGLQEGFVGEVPGGWLQVLAPGSIVARRDAQGVLRDIEIIEPEIVVDEEPRLYYRYRVPAGAKALVPAEKIDCVGDQWRMVLWNPNTGDYQEIENDAMEAGSAAERPVSIVDSVAPNEAGT